MSDIVSPTTGNVDGVLPVSSYCLPFLPSQVFTTGATSNGPVSTNGVATLTSSHQPLPQHQQAQPTSVNHTGFAAGHHVNDVLLASHHHLNGGPHKLRV